MTARRTFGSASSVTGVRIAARLDTTVDALFAEATPLDNLLPWCSRHHHKVPDDGWQLTLGPNRELTVRFPDDAIPNTGPPRRSAA